jgi:biopolymer transport protein ExbD
VSSRSGHGASEGFVEHRTARRRHGRERPRIALNLTAMIDVTFLLLIYFLTATQFKLGEEVYRLDVPERAAAREIDPFKLDDEPLVIGVRTLPGGSYELDLNGPYRDKPNSFHELLNWLRSRCSDAANPSGLFATDHPIIIEPTDTTTWQHTMAAFNAVARARFTNVTLGRPGRSQEGGG